jgi:hypothetical protein
MKYSNLTETQAVLAMLSEELQLTLSEEVVTVTRTAKGVKLTAIEGQGFSGSGNYTYNRVSATNIMVKNNPDVNIIPPAGTSGERYEFIVPSDVTTVAQADAWLRAGPLSRMGVINPNFVLDQSGSLAVPGTVFVQYKVDSSSLVFKDDFIVTCTVEVVDTSVPLKDTTVNDRFQESDFEL